MRVESQKPARCSLGGWIHAVTGAPPVEYSPREKPAPPVDVDWPKRARDLFDAHGAGRAREESATSLGVSTDSLERLGVGVGFDVAGRFTSWPERGADGRTVGIVRRYADGSKKHMPGGHAGLYLASGWSNGRGPILLVEGGSDTAGAITMGLCVVGRPSNTGGIELLATVLANHPDKAVVVVGENDRKPDRAGTIAHCPAGCPGCSWCWPGLFGAKLTAQRLTEALGRKIHHRQVVGAKDAREWVLANGPDGHAFVESLRRCAGA